MWSKEKDLWQTVWILLPKLGERGGSTSASQHIRTKPLLFSPVPVYPSQLLVFREKKYIYINPKSCLALDLKHKVVCWVSNCVDFPTLDHTQHKAAIDQNLNFLSIALQRGGCYYTSYVRAVICFYLVLYFKLLLLITVSRGFGLLKLSKSHNSFLCRERMIRCLSSLSYLFPLCWYLSIHLCSFMPAPPPITSFCTS